MSVEEARRRLWDSLMDFEDSFADDLDRLILEVQADCECEWSGGDQIFDCIGEFNGEIYPEFGRRGELCKTCTARMKLKEIADATSLP